MEFIDLKFLGLGFAGILLHCLFNIKKLKDSGKPFSWGEYLGAEWVTITISFVCVFISIVCKNEFMHEASILGDKLGLAFVTIGFTGQSMFVTLMGKVTKQVKSLTGDDTKTDQP